MQYIALQVKYKDIVLTDLLCSASPPQKYARKLLNEVYTKEEPASGLFNKVGFSAKGVLSPTRKTLIWSTCYLCQRGNRYVCMHAYKYMCIHMLLSYYM